MCRLPPPIRASGRPSAGLDAGDRFALRRHDEDLAEGGVRDKEPFFLIYRQPSGALVPKNKLNRHTFAAPPSRISGTRQMLLSRVIATNNTASSGLSTSPFALGPSEIRQSSRPAGHTEHPAARIVHSSLPPDR